MLWWLCVCMRECAIWFWFFFFQFILFEEMHNIMSSVMLIFFFCVLLNVSFVVHCLFVRHQHHYLCSITCLLISIVLRWTPRWPVLVVHRKTGCRLQQRIKYVGRPVGRTKWPLPMQEAMDRHPIVRNGFLFSHLIVISYLLLLLLFFFFFCISSSSTSIIWNR